MKFFFFSIFAVFLIVPFSAFGDIFSLWPFSKGAGAASVSMETVSGLLESKKFWSEPVVANGQKITLEIRLSDMKVKDAVQILKQQYPGMKIASSGQFVLAELPLNQNKVRRLYLMELAGIHPLLLFSMDIPKHFQQSSPDQWPSMFPLVSGARELTVYSFPSRKASFGSYFVPGVSKPQLLRDIASSMRATGWIPATGEAENVFSGTGEVYMKNDPQRMAIISVLDSVNGKGARASFYERPLN